MKKNFLYVILVLFLALMISSCNDWLNILPNNEQVTDDYWKSKEDVESVLASGYYYLRESAPSLIKWGELRGGAIYSSNAIDTKLQDFNITPNDALCDYSTLYKAIGMANSVIKYAPGVRNIDHTYYESMMKSNLCEAYFIRSYCYLILLKNYKEVPLITDAYVDDGQNFNQPKVSDTLIVNQIKKDVTTALATEAAKTTYSEDWQTKGRATKWALYAVMADVCLWNEDYDECIKYCDLILHATDSFRPVFMTNTADWFTMFYPGNSNESIFELNWNYSTGQETNNFSSLFGQSNSSRLRPTQQACLLMREETQELKDKGFSDDARMGRMLLATYVPDNGTSTGWSTSNQYYIWKYYGTDVQDITGGARTHQDANFIIYRVAEIMMMKAQALTMKGKYFQAVELINKLRKRAGLGNFKDIDTSSDDAQLKVSQLDEQTILEEVLNQKEMEFMGEGKRWYDLLWFGKIQNYKYEKQFIYMVVEGNQTTNQAWIESVLQDHNAWYMPLPQKDIDHNQSLVQNPYYATTK
jgi:hypothetical protein